MKTKIVTGIMLPLLLVGVTLAFNIQPVKASGTIYIRADGSVDPPDAPITSVDNITYTFTSNITGSIVVERNNAIVDGGGHTLSTEMGDAFTLSNINNVAIQNTRIHSYWGDCIRFSNSSFNTISGNDLSMHAYERSGVSLSNSSNNTISGNNMSARICCGFAIKLNSSSFNNVSENNIWCSYSNGISLFSSSSNNMFRNDIEGIGDGITLGSSSFNNISENYLDCGQSFPMWFGNSSNNTILRNTCRGRLGVSFYSSNNNTIHRNNITGMQNGLDLIGASNNNICENDIENNDIGISLMYSSNNNISGNNINGPEAEWPEGCGISLRDSSDNIMSGNNITNNGYGISLEASSNNRFHHNNLIDNTQHAYIAASGYPNVWDDGYPSGGNYWSNYNGTDYYSGPYQNETYRDGIGDTPHVIDEDNQDNYPLMSPWPPAPWYIKSPYPDYAPSGMPDFDQRQWGTYNWTDALDRWSHCGPVACANSLWWLDSEFEPSSIPPPTTNDGFVLLQSYGSWDDHDPQNVPSFVEHLAWLMDCDGRRTGQSWYGTYVKDMEAGLAQYLSWSGANPLGDVNGDGSVNQTDVDLVTAALGSTPSDPNWNLAADIFPATTTYPPTTDNIINSSDLAIVNGHLGENGMFYVHKEHGYEDSEFFYLIREEVEKCQDVILLLGFYDEGTDNRVGGHYVTVAGVELGKLELLISDPIQDDFEAGNTTGRSPVPHPYPHNSTIHNNASLVSQDAYNATLSLSPSGYPWLFQRYFPQEYNLEARIEYAVITSPQFIHDVAVTNLTLSKTIVSQGYSMNVTVTVKNQGNFAETFNVTAYANTTAIKTMETTLTSGNSTTLIFTWNTTGWDKGNYTISANATTVSEEIDTIDNSYTVDTVRVNMVGDVAPEYGIVDMLDVVYVAIHFGAEKGQLEYEPNADINGDGIIDIVDIVAVAIHFGETDP